MGGPAFIPYYIDYSVKNQSKTIGVSKKRITFKFGFANRQAVDDGLVGAHCRGSEHEVVFTWSLNSGKRHVTLDGKDVHFSTSGQNGWTSDRTWQHVFNLKVPGFSGTFRCHLISQPSPQGSNIRPFDLRVGGVSIFKFNQIYQLGTSQMTVRKPGGSRAINLGGEGDESLTAEEQRMMAQARLESMKEYQKYQERTSQAALGAGGPTSSSNGTGDLLMSFDDPNPPPPSSVAAPPMPAQQGMNQGHMVSSLTLGSDYGGSPNPYPGAPGGQQQQQQQPPYGYPQQQQQPPPQQQQYGQQPYGGGSVNSGPPVGYPQQQQQQSYPPQSGQSYASGSAATAPTTNAMTPYQASPGQASAGYNNYGVASSFAGSTASTAGSTQAPAPSFAASLDPYAKPPADPWATPAPAPPPAAAATPTMQHQSSFGGQPPQQQQYGGYPPQQPPMSSPMAETQMSAGTYGSAPTFARPPQQQQQQQPSYGQAYAPPAQYQQQQFQPTGY